MKTFGYQILDSESEYFTLLPLLGPDKKFTLLPKDKDLNMRIILSGSKSEAVKTVATILTDHIASNPSAVIGLATGRTMEPLYAEWVRVAKESNIDHSGCFFFMLDEYLGIPSHHPSSFKEYIVEHLIRPMNLRMDQVAFPPTQSEDLSQAAAHYESLIRESGGIDIQLLGIGTNGHIGFNEPGSSAATRTRIVSLSDETKKANAFHFQGSMPDQALSMGIATILESKALVLLATGNSKAETIKYLLNHHDDPGCPATFLKSHSHFTLVLDPEASSRINLKI
jgi:glucosamine-6-phosphate deaminase